MEDYRLLLQKVCSLYSRVDVGRNRLWTYNGLSEEFPEEFEIVKEVVEEFLLRRNSRASTRVFGLEMHVDNLEIICQERASKNHQ
jgi:hypothetical protein